LAKSFPGRTMLPEVKFAIPRDPNIHAVGVGFRRDGEDWKFYLPFKGVSDWACPGGNDIFRGTCVEFVLPLSDRRAVAANRQGEFALIDLVADRVVCKAKTDTLLRHVQQSADGKHLFAHNGYSLSILDAATLAIVQRWEVIENKETGWVKYDDRDTREVKRQKIDARKLDRLNLTGPLMEFEDGRLTSPFRQANDYYGKEQRSGSLIFDIATGAVERRTGAGHKPEGPFLPQPAEKALVHAPSHYDIKGDDAFEQVFIREAMVTLVAPSCEKDDCIAVLRELASRIESDFHAMLVCDAFSPRFVVAGEVEDCETFFGRFVDEDWSDAAPELRRVLWGYLTRIHGGEDGRPWASAGSALRALMLLDLDAQDVFRLYIDKGDLEHEHGPYEFYEEFVARRGWRNAADVEFSLYLTIRGCFDTEVDPTTPIEMAEQFMTAQDAATQIREIFERFQLSDCISDYVKRLAPASPYVEEVARTLVAR
jgi:hypothetical protein